MDVAILLSQTVPDILSAITGAPVTTLSDAFEGLPEDENSRMLVAMSGLRGDVNGIVALACSEQTAANLFERVVDGYVKRTEENVRDLMAEVLNLVVGHMKAGLFVKGKRTQHSIPSVLSCQADTDLPHFFETEPPLLLESVVGRFSIYFVPEEASLEL